MNRGMLRWVFSAMLGTTALSVPATAQDSPREQAEDAEEAKVRLHFMTDALSQYTVQVHHDDDSAVAKLVPEPALRWTNTLSRTRDGIVGVWTRGGRPDVVAQFSGPNVWVYEFCSTSLDPLAMERSGRVVWAPKAPGIHLQAVPNAPAPAATAAQRMVQMRNMAERFEIIDDFHPVYGKPQIERTKLRLLAKPLYRYRASDTPVDGALFGWVIATDPEALLMLEAYDTPNGRQWRYALARMTVYGLTAKLDGVEVWQAPERLAGSWAFDDPYYVGVYR